MATITKRKWKTGKGEQREAWVLAFTDAAGERHKEQFAKMREAQARRVEVEGQVAKGTYRQEASNTTVEDACRSYLTYLEGRHGRGERVTTTYLKTTEAQLYNYVAPQPDRAVTFSDGIGQVRLSQLTARGVADFRDRLRDAGVGVVTTRRILGSLSRVLSFAAEKDLVAMNVASGVRVIGKRDEGAKKVVPPTKLAIAACLKAADPDFRLKLKFSAAAGLRASELHALRWSHLDLKAGEVTVSERLDVFGETDTTKSQAGQRTIPLAASLVKELKEWNVRSKFSKSADLVFPNTQGGHVAHRNMMRRQFNPLLALAAEAEAAEGRRFQAFAWHALRHFAISTWIESGLQPKTVQTFAGHSSLAVTMTRYGHLFPSDDHRDAMDRIAASLFADGA